ncbi:MAG: biopolymer transporter ExbD [Kiritimatiellia bacterium]
MAVSTPHSSLKQISEINLTPLMDLTFILLITFIITFPLIEQGIPVNLPEAKASEIDAQSARSVSIDRDGRIYLENVPVSIDNLAVKLGAMVRAGDPPTVMVRADKSVRYGRVAAVMRVLHETGVSKLALVTKAQDTETL